MPNIPIKQLNDGVDIYPLTTAKAVLTSDGSNVELVLRSMGGSLYVPCTVNYDDNIIADGKYRKLVGAINSEGKYVLVLDQTPYIFDSESNSWIPES